MSDPDPRQHGQPAESSDTTAQHAAPAPQRSPGQEAAARNPYAEQPLAGPYANGQPQYPINGQYPVIANEQRQAGSPHPASHPGSVPGAPVNGMAIAALVLGIVGVVTGGFLFVPQILAIILGHLSLNKDRQSRAFAIAGLVMGYLVTGLWVIGVIGFIGLVAIS